LAGQVLITILENRFHNVCLAMALPRYPRIFSFIETPRTRRRYHQF